MHALAVGKCYLASLSEQQLGERLRGKLEQVTEHTMVSRRALRAEIATVRETGYAVVRVHS
jgi:DNA-binding IclR family transcriptional regulator